MEALRGQIEAFGKFFDGFGDAVQGVGEGIDVFAFHACHEGCDEIFANAFCNAAVFAASQSKLVERWAVFINEYGMVSLDEALLDQPAGDEVQVQELAGGCFCCETADLFKPMLVQFMRRARPHRLLIEPSGAGHPAAVLDMLREGP
ncbi:MAG: GTP-binding protein, partial [Planctomycetaceae bacterium]